MQQTLGQFKTLRPGWGLVHDYNSDLHKTGNQVAARGVLEHPKHPPRYATNSSPILTKLLVAIHIGNSYHSAVSKLSVKVKVQSRIYECTGIMSYNI